MTLQKYEETYSNKDHILIRLMDSFPYFDAKKIVENGVERIEKNYHIADGLFSCYINYELHPVPLAAEISNGAYFELCKGYSCPILITNVGENPVHVGFEKLGDNGDLYPKEVLAIYPEEAAEETHGLFRVRQFKEHINKHFISQEEMDSLLRGDGL